MDKEEKTMWIITVFVIIIFIAGIFLQAYIEMNTFNKYSEVDANYIEALFSNLRIIAK